MEKNVGITEYLSDGVGFFAIIKQRYSDFLVNEIDKNGVVVHLTSLSPPKSEALPAPDEVVSEIPGEIHQLIPADKLSSIDAIGDKCSSPVEIDCSALEKCERTKIHNFIREFYRGKLDSDTSTSEEKSVIRVYVAKQGGRKRKRWPSERGGQFLRFVLYKENLDTQHAASIIAQKLRMKASDLKFAGTKDRRAKTSQLCSIFKGDPVRMAKLNGLMNNLKLGNFEFSAEDLSLGDCSGNRFTVVLRNVSAAEEVLADLLKSVESNGFINYFGAQRFGTTSVPTHAVGRAILQNKWEEAVNLILTAKDGYDDPEITTALIAWSESKDPTKSLSLMSPRKRDTSLEGLLLKGLQKHGATNYVNGMSFMPYNSRLLYIHSYQSFIWNQVVSQRIRLHGMKVLPGDLVFDAEPNEVSAKTSIAAVRCIKDDEVESVTPWDILMPQPGHSVLLPNSSSADVFKTLLAADDLSLSSFDHRVKDYSARGDYRKMLQRPTQFDWKFLRYDDATVPLTLSDLDILTGAEQPVSREDGKMLALVLNFSLPTSCYATMLIRELTKMDTSSGFQSTLNEKLSEEEPVLEEAPVVS